MERKFEDVIPLWDDWEILSDNGWSPISKICKTIPYEEWTIRTTSFVLTCADTHILFDKNDKPVFVKDIKVGDKIVTERGLEPVLYLFNSTKQSNMYDVEVNSSSHSYNSNGIISHNTTITTIFICHYLIFNADKNVALLANKGSMAREILSRIQLSYIHLPKWMQIRCRGMEQRQFQAGEWFKGYCRRYIIRFCKTDNPSPLCSLTKWRLSRKTSGQSSFRPHGPLFLLVRNPSLY